MSVYIPSLNLPNKDYGKMVVTIYPDGSVVEYLGDIGRDFGTAIPVSPHGRLGDLDKLESNLRNMAKYQSGYRQQGILGCCETIRLAPTIIPASKEDENG